MTTEAAPKPPLLSAEGLVKYFGRRKVVDQVSVTVRPGEIVGLLGKNGAGKTTSFRMIVGMIQPDAGKVWLRTDGDPVDITRLPMYKRARLGMGYLSQEPSIFRQLTVAQNILAILEAVGVPRADRKPRLDALLQEFRLGHLAANRASTLSGGERRRLEIARTLVIRPRIILLDEPFSGVDPMRVSELQDLIADLRNRGMGILLTDHNVYDTLKITDRAYVLEEGAIMTEGTSEGILKDEKARKYYLGDRFSMDLGKPR